MQESDWPKTVEEAVEKFIESLCEEDREYIRKHAFGEPGFMSLQMGIAIGRSIRNQFGLWRGNKALIQDAGREHPDDASAVIRERIWDMLYEGDKNEDENRIY